MRMYLKQYKTGRIGNNDATVDRLLRKHGIIRQTRFYHSGTDLTDFIVEFDTKEAAQWILDNFTRKQINEDWNTVENGKTIPCLTRKELQEYAEI